MKKIKTLADTHPYEEAFAGLQKYLNDFQVLHEGMEHALKDSQAWEAQAKERVVLLENEMAYQRVEVTRTMCKDKN